MTLSRINLARIHLDRSVSVLGLLALVAACAPKEAILPGERLDPRTPLTELSAPADGYSAEAPVNKSVAIALPAGGTNAEWTHRGGNATHSLTNPTLRATLTPVWTANVGAGDSRKTRIAADPIVAGGRIFTLDAQDRVTATGTNGGALWTTGLTPVSDRPGDASGGGIAYGDGKLFVTTGFGELVALDAASGGIAWRQKFDMAIGGAPAVTGGTVFVVARDASAWAVNAADGKVKWTLLGAPAGAGVPGVSAPASDGKTAVFPFSGGQMAAIDTTTGQGIWSAFVGGKRLGRAFANISDLTGDPVMAGGLVYAGSSAGRLVAISATTGQTVWAADEGAVSPVVVAGGSVFLVSDEARLIRLDAATGALIWAVDMPYYIPTRKEKKRQAITVNYGPVLAGGRLVVASSDGVIRSFDPASGNLVGQVDLPGGAAAAPAVAGGTLYVLSRRGQLHAFR